MNKRLNFGLICQRTLFQLITDIWLAAPDSTYLWKLSFSHCNKYPPVISIHLDILITTVYKSSLWKIQPQWILQYNITNTNAYLWWFSIWGRRGKEQQTNQQTSRNKTQNDWIKKICFPNEMKMTTHGTAVYRLMRSWVGGVQLEMKIRKQLTFICYRKRQRHLKTGVKFYEIGK